MSKPTVVATTSDNWIVMPVRDCAALTRTAIESCLAQDIGPVRIMVMDNGSTNGVLSYLRSVPQVQVVYSPPPLGVSAMWNVALEHLFHLEKVEHVLVVNNDIKLRADAYRLLVEDGGPFVTCVGTSSGAIWPGGPPSGEKRLHPDFSCFLIRRKCWDAVGPFDEKMAIYASDQDYHLRMHKAGIDAYCLDLPFYHYASGTLKQADEGDKERILKQAQVDREAFVSKWGFAGGSEEYYNKFKREEVKV